MIKICSLREFNQYKSEDNFLIVRSCKTPIEGLRQLPHLSPSSRLFSYYLNNRSDEGWFDNYATDFKHEMSTEEKQNGVKFIAGLCAEGKDVTLVCYCWDVEQCHRRLVGEYFKELGFEVEIH